MIARNMHTKRGQIRWFRSFAGQLALVALAVGVGVAAGTAPAAAATTSHDSLTSTSTHALRQPGRVYTFRRLVVR